MKILFSWLKEFLEISLHPEALAQRLTLSGTEVTDLARADGDWIFELEITPNRPDLLSHLGIARETSAVLGRSFRLSRGLKGAWALPDQPPPPFPVVIEDPQGCERYCGILIEGVVVKESPQEIATRLSRLGVRPVNNVVDITNLCLLELGQPLHAFDLDRLEGRTLRVRGAGPKETLVTLDGVSRSLPPGSLVIADAKRPVALAGIMGGRDAEITPKTRRIFLESAWFKPERIRKASREIKLSSDSSYRFERGVDPGMVPLAPLRAARLIKEVAGGRIEGGLIGAGQGRPARRPILLRPSRVQDFLGMRIYPAQQRRFLERLGCRVTGSSRSYRVEPPSWRSDLRIPEDLYEELARLWGYERCSATLPPFPRQAVTSSWKSVEDPWIGRERDIRQCLSAAGMQEILTYSLVNPADHERAKSLAGKTPLELENPLSVDQAVLRNTLRIGALQTLARNLNRKTAESLQLFEMGRLFGGDPKESRTLGLLVAGTPAPSWGIRPKPLGLLHLKGIVQLLCGRLRLDLQTEAGFIGGGFVSPGIRFEIGGKPFGTAGQVDSAVLAAFEIPADFPVAYAELNLERMGEISPKPVRVQRLPKVPSVLRDLAVLLPQESSHGTVLQAIRQAGGPLLREAHLFDLYQGPQVPAGKKSLAFRLEFSAGDRTLTEEEIAAAFQKIMDGLKTGFDAALR